MGQLASLHWEKSYRTGVLHSTGVIDQQVFSYLVEIVSIVVAAWVFFTPSHSPAYPDPQLLHTTLA